MPPKLSEASEASRHKTKFGKGSEYTKVFDDFDERVQALLLERAELEDGELPILACFRPPANDGIAVASPHMPPNERASNWFLLTTRRVIWTNPDQQFFWLRHENVESVGWSTGPKDWPGRDISSPPDTMVHTEHGTGYSKHYSPWLHIIDFSGDRYEVFLEPGRNLVAIRNSIWQLSGGWSISLDRARVSNKESANSSLAVGSDAYKAKRFELHHQEFYSHLLFKSLAPEIQDFFVSKTQMHNDELPVFGFLEDRQTWLFGTTRKILWSGPGFEHQLNYVQIHRMGQSEYEKLGPPTGDGERMKERLRQISLMKTRSPDFYFIDDGGNRYEAIFPPGQTLFSIWNMILFMCN